MRVGPLGGSPLPTAAVAKHPLAWGSALAAAAPPPPLPPVTRLVAGSFGSRATTAAASSRGGAPVDGSSDASSPSVAAALMYMTAQLELINVSLSALDARMGAAERGLAEVAAAGARSEDRSWQLQHGRSQPQQRAVGGVE